MYNDFQDIPPDKESDTDDDVFQLDKDVTLDPLATRAHP